MHDSSMRMIHTLRVARNPTAWNELQQRLQPNVIAYVCLLKHL